MSLSPRQRQYLKGLAHRRRPVVIIGNAGLSSAVVKEIDQALARHELLKVRLPAADRATRNTLFSELCHATGAEPVQLIGHVACIYRRAEKPRIDLPALRALTDT